MYSPTHLLFNEKVLARLCYHLSIRDIVILGQTSHSLQQRIFSDGEVWKQRNLICQSQDRRWLLQPIIQRLIPQIPRYHGLQTLKIHNLPSLNAMSFFLILDHCAHSVHHLDLMMSLSQCHELCKHLEAFCFHLATSQAWNKIPLTLHQYTLDSNHLYQQAQTNLTPSSQPFFINQLISHGLPTKMDDPPFETLDRLTVTLLPGDCHGPFSSSDVIPSPSASPTILIKQFHHLIELLSRYSPILTCSTGSSETYGATVRNPIIPTPAFFQTPPPLSVSSSSGVSSFSSILDIADITGKRSISSSESTPLLLNKESSGLTNKKRKKQQAEAKRKQDYYDRIHQLSHQCRPRSLSNSPPPSPSTPPPHRVDTFISSPTTTTVARRQHHHASTPIVHVMRCHRPPMKK